MMTSDEKALQASLPAGDELVMYLPALTVAKIMLRNSMIGQRREPCEGWRAG
ncbi:hypothetical protein [Pseudomonas amygdali]|uniref:hypothetical protein n=1 Tax=Pseudomonas amygdali TaxID=47877 RepID=UPI0035320F64